MFTIYHNTRCSKSREGLEILRKSGKKFQIREYLKEPLSEEEVTLLLNKLTITPIELIRKNEKVWKENYKGRDLSDREIIQILAQNPILIERPIVENDFSAILGRPPSQIEKLL